MEYIFEILLIVVGVLLAGVAAWGVSVLKNRFDLDPGGSVMKSLEYFEQHAVDWIMAEAAKRGEDVSLPEIQNKYLDAAVQWVIPKVPKVMDFLGYSKDDLRKDLETLLHEYLGLYRK